MPPIQQQQSSRTGLITALVLAIVAAIGLMIWAFMENSGRTKAEQGLLTFKAKYKTVIPDSMLEAGTIDSKKTEFSADAGALRTGSLVEAASAQRKALVKLITGQTDGTEKDALTAFETATKTIADNPALKGTTVVTDSLSGMINTLSSKVKSDMDAVATAKAALDAANTSLQAAMAQHKTEIEQREAKVKEANDLATKAAEDSKLAIDLKQKQVDDFAKQKGDAEKAMADLQAAQQVELQTLQRNVQTAKTEYAKAESKLALYRQDVKNVIVRQVDCLITQTAADNICYINLGFGDHVVPGLTFEVYGKLDGVPKLEQGTSQLDLPKGKASIEIISVGQNSSQARIITIKSGVQLEQGDVCANLVYDKNIKPVFYVYGNFDTDQNGVATPQETENIKNLIIRWGGKMSDKLTVEVDFVILGKEPVLPPYTAEELKEPIPAKRFADAQAALKEYEDQRGTASSYHIPLMNQNRFLYYTGYFDQSKK